MAPAFLVDGLTEKKIVQRLCNGATVRLTGLNGKDVALEAIAKAAHSLIALLKGRHYPIVLIVDREKRPQSALEMEEELAALLKGLGVSTKDIIISCPDRMIENWMLGDERYFDEVYDIKISSCCEGLHGKREIRRLMLTKKITYHEVSVGVDLFCQIDPGRVAASSQSFDRFRSRVSPFCPHWLATPSVEAPSGGG
ncbi:DUF4276 family protein [Bradyrhizobium sp. LVM 105]|uniref:DUF4276 family protein n=1 Tax=Bradyrhizobium sp. LVM 105 TaxID=2341115 RepID=UPI000F806107|nr:DUF4276 family protein [Bradyrhizobium sp. LVM 105]RTE89467.1 DUF4276 family protein [Bradyrhizobium sp. LVM 105]